MNLFARVSLTLAVASGNDVGASYFDDVGDEAMSLLQIAARKHNHTHEDFSLGNGHCAFKGDTHSVDSFIGKTADPQQLGLFTMTNSKDGRFKAQLYQCNAKGPVGVSWINAMAFEIDGNQIVILPPQVSEIYDGKPAYIRANDKEFTTADLPYTIPGTNIDLQPHSSPGGYHNFRIVTEGFSSIVTTWTHTWPHFFINVGVQLSPDNVADNSENSFCWKGPAALPLLDDTMDTDWSDSLFTNSDHDSICTFCQDRNAMKWPDLANAMEAKCAKPPPRPPPPPAQEECKINGCSWTHAQQLCHSLKGDDILYNDCMFDFCVECHDESAVEFVEEDENDNPGPLCVAGAPECAPEEVCTTAIKMNTLTVTQNNLGGVGPDSGAEEIRYSNAAVVGGRAVDLVLTTDGTFQSSKPSKNGNAGPFGVLNMKCGTSFTVIMKVVDSENGSPVVLDAVALTWYDLDEGRKAKGRATVTTCGTTGAIVSENTELTLKREGDCTSASSSVAGTGKDNPTSPHQLTSLQVARAFTLPFKQVSELTSTLSLEKGFKGRNFLFAIEPSVACL